MSAQRSTRDPAGRVVELTHERWAHIELGHPELGDLLDEVLDTVASPHVRRVGREPNEEWFYRQRVGPSRWLKVVVLYEGSRGFIVTAHPRRSFP
jgi:hypothetical protein